MKRLITMLVLVGALCACRVGADAPTDVPRDHWAYEAVRSLVDEGYMIGFPDGSFLGNRTLTRYEFATVIKRIMDGISERLLTQTTVEKPVQTTGQPTKQAVSTEDIATLKKLVDEFKPELAVIGARIDKLESEIEQIKSEMENVHTIIGDEEGPLQATRADVSKLKKVTVSGYVQARYNVFKNSFDDEKKETIDNFSIRRARIKVGAKPTDKSGVTIQLDAGQGTAGDKSPSVSLKDAYVEHNFAGDPLYGLSLQMGQMKWPFGYEVVQSSGVRETPERSLIVQRLFPGERDRGFMFSLPIGRNLMWKYGVFNGVETKFGDPNNAKDNVMTIRFDYGDITGGISGYYGRGIIDDAGALYMQNTDPKWRYGADVQYYANRLSLKAEYIVGKGVDGMKAGTENRDALYKTVSGGYAQAAFNLTPVDTLVAKYETLSLDVRNSKYGRRSAWHLGLIRQLDEKTRLKAFYQINQEEKKKFDNNQFTFEWITNY